nr:TolB-like 6-bladed beta-propeller domain-containing protein [Aquiflexum lacus]
MPHYEYLGSFLKRGEGPVEFMQGPSASSKSKVVRENGQLVAYLYDFEKGNLKRFDIGQTITSGELHISLMEASFPPFLSNFIMVDSSTFFIKEIGNRDTQQIRQLIVSGEKTDLPVLDKLNQAALKEGGDFNMLATNTEYNDVHQRFVEAPTDLNYINLYSLDSAIAKTICIGDKLTDIGMVQNERPQWNRKYVFVNNKAFDDFFGVIYVNESFKDYQTIRRRLPSIFLFDWEGKPLAELKMKNHFTHFDIDFINRELYTFDVHSDEFFKFDIGDILAGLKRSN